MSTDTFDRADAAGRLLRGVVEVQPGGGLSPLLESRDQVRVKFGIDPSGSELTLGHAVALRKLRQFQDEGHLVVLVIGDFTATLGDPTDRAGSRPPLTFEQTTDNAETYLEQAGKILLQDRLEVRRNSEWLSPLPLLSFIGLAQQATVAQLLEREDFAARFSSHKPIAVSELLYPLLQGYDSVAIRADIEIGGTDQLFNMMMGRVLQRTAGLPAQAVMTLPILEGLDGVKKMSKSLGNYISLLDSSDQMFGKVMSIPDALVHRYGLLCTGLPEQELDRIRDAAMQSGPAAAHAKRAVARAIVTEYHSGEEAHTAETAFNERFRDREPPVDARVVTLHAVTDEVFLPIALRDLALVKSSSEARRLIDSGAVRLNGKRVPSGQYTIPTKQLVGAVIQVGKLRAVRVADDRVWRPPNVVDSSGPDRREDLSAK